MIYLFFGQDSSSQDAPLSSKDTRLKQIKEEFLPKGVEHFNLDTLYAETLKLKELQEKLLALPVESPRRIVVIKNAQELSPDMDDFILRWAKQASKDILLLLDIEKQGKKEAFLRGINKYAKVFNFKETLALNTFNLSRRIEQRSVGNALTVLDQLLKNGEKPERILGGLRYTVENSRMSALETKRRIRFLLECDIEIKTGKLKPVFALEKLIVKLCSLAQPFH
jgi:DNA polymerase III delta subunit